MPSTIFQALLAAFTLCLVVVGVLQYLILDATDKTLKAAQRPWIEFDEKIVTPLELTDDGKLFVAIELGLKNSGHSPALYVRASAEMYLKYQDLEIGNIQTKICESLKDRGEWGYAIFPDNKRLPETLVLAVDKKQVSQYKADKDVGFRRPIIIGCVVYFYEAEKSFHNTGFVYLLRPIPAFE